MLQKRHLTVKRLKTMKNKMRTEITWLFCCCFCLSYVLCMSRRMLASSFSKEAFVWTFLCLGIWHHTSGPKSPSVTRFHRDPHLGSADAEIKVYSVENPELINVLPLTGVGMAQWQSNGLVIERSRVRVPAGAAGEFSSPGLNFCAGSYFCIFSTPVLPQ